MKRIYNIDDFMKSLIEHYIYSSWQFIEYTEESIAIVNY